MSQSIKEHNHGFILLILLQGNSPRGIQSYIFFLFYFKYFIPDSVPSWSVLTRSAFPLSRGCLAAKRHMQNWNECFVGVASPQCTSVQWEVYSMQLLTRLNKPRTRNFWPLHLVWHEDQIEWYIILSDNWKFKNFAQAYHNNLAVWQHLSY